MPTVSLTLRTTTPPAELERALRHPEELPLDDVDGIDVAAAAEAGRTYWDIPFRGARLSWVQRDVAAPGRSEFAQVDGDFASMTGSWAIDGDTVRFTYTFRTSIAHLAGAVDPIAARVLLRSAHRIVSAATDAPVTVDDGEEHLQDLAHPAGATS